MKFTRRDFVKFSGIAAATFGFSKSIFAESDFLANQTAHSFRQLIGTKFYISGNDISTTAILSKVEDFPQLTKGGECFSLAFDIPLKRAKQATYNISHPNLGNFDLLMTEGRNGENCVLLATINRI